jgi:hypothetical protein
VKIRSEIARKDLALLTFATRVVGLRDFITKRGGGKVNSSLLHKFDPSGFVSIGNGQEVSVLCSS